jgi:hypothetical protein
MDVQPSSGKRRCSSGALRAAVATAILTLVTAASASAAAASKSPAHAQPQDAHILGNWKLIAIVAAVLVLVSVNWVLVRRSRRISARRRREIPSALLFLLGPIYRYDNERDAWILRVVGKRLGPVLRPHKYRDAWLDVSVTDDDSGTPAPSPTKAYRSAPHPLPPLTATRTRARRKDGSSIRQEHEPPPLTIRRPPD